ncbi:MAG: hypothetical protein ACF8R7_14825 [Phycisphaerales bacterium JB039]
MTGTVALLLASLGLLIVFGVALLIAGLRGRRINDHPVCRRCRFDLAGVYPAQQRCPECGRDLHEARRVRTGVRRRRRWAIATGALLLAMGAIGLSGAGYVWARGANLNPYKPAWLLAMETGSLDAPTARAALSELTARIDSQSLGVQRIATLVERALAAQTDLDQPWLTEWGDLVEVARAWGHVPDADYAQYLRQSLAWEGALTLQMRHRIASGDELPVGVSMRGARAGNRGGLWFSAQLKRLRIGESVYIMPETAGRAHLGLSGGSRGSVTTSSLPIDAPPGTQPVEAIWAVAVGPGPAGVIAGGPPPAAPDPPPTPTVEWSVTLNGELDVLAPGTPVITEVGDPSVRPALLEAIQLQGARVRRGEDSALRPSGTISLNQLPVAVGFDIYWRAGHAEWKVGSAAAPAGQGWATSYGSAADPAPPGFDARRVDIVLRSNPEAARPAAALTEIWKGEIVFEDVEIEWPEDTPDP